jgi:hypothetical protein
MYFNPGPFLADLLTNVDAYVRGEGTQIVYSAGNDYTSRHRCAKPRTTSADLQQEDTILAAWRQHDESPK